jgi:hypothetical protein
VNVENPAALRFIMQDDIFLLNKDKTKPAEKPEQPVLKTPEISFNYLGKNKKNLLIVVHYPDTEFIAEAHLTALENILKRLDYAIDDVAILNIAKHSNTAIDDLQAYFSPQKLLILGKPAMPAKMENPALNEVKQIAALTALYSFSFDEMMSSTDNKKAFWDQMKNL